MLSSPYSTVENKWTFSNTSPSLWPSRISTFCSSFICQPTPLSNGASPFWNHRFTMLLKKKNSPETHRKKKWCSHRDSKEEESSQHTSTEDSPSTAQLVTTSSSQINSWTDSKRRSTTSYSRAHRSSARPCWNRAHQWISLCRTILPSRPQLSWGK
jgi:hypothetical protein